HAHVVLLDEGQGGLDLGVVDVVVGAVVAGVGDARHEHVQFGVLAQGAGPADVAVELVIDAVVGVAEVDVGSKAADVEAAGMCGVHVQLQRRVFHGLGDAAPDVVAGSDQLTAELPGGVGAAVLREGGQGGEGEQGGGEGGAGDQAVHIRLPGPGWAKMRAPYTPARVG